MSAIDLPWSGGAGQGAGYQPSRRFRYAGLAAVLLLHGAVVMLLVWRGPGFSGEDGHGGAGRGQAAVFELLPQAAPVSRQREGGGDDIHPADLRPPQPSRPAQQAQAGSGAGEGPGVAELGEDLARLLADDPVSGGGVLDYRTALRRHVARHTRPLTDARGRRHDGTVILRARLSRDGQIVDTRVLRSHGAQMDEAALATLWRAEPLPPVPEDFAVPFEVDVSIDFTGARSRSAASG